MLYLLLCKHYLQQNNHQEHKPRFATKGFVGLLPFHRQAGLDLSIPILQALCPSTYSQFASVLGPAKAWAVGAAPLAGLKGKVLAQLHWSFPAEEQAHLYAEITDLALPQQLSCGAAHGAVLGSTAPGNCWVCVHGQLRWQSSPEWSCFYY